MGNKGIVVNKSDELRELLESNSIPDEEIMEVIQSAESGGTKFYEEGVGHFLGGKRLSEIKLYVMYTPVGNDVFDIEDVYWHRSIVDLSSERE